MEITGIIIDKGMMKDGSIINLKKSVIWDHHNKKDCVLVTKDFCKDDPNKIIGHAKCYLDKNIMKADIDIYDDVLFEKEVKHLTPAISGKVIKRNGKKIEKFELLGVALCSSQNIDESIQTIKKQIIVKQ